MRSRAEFLASLPRKRVSVGVVIRDDGGRVLLVEPAHRREWLLPGGSVEAEESPRRGAAREVLEELGVPLPIGRPLVMQWLRNDDDPDGVLHFVYDGGAVGASTVDRFRLPEEELRSFRFVQTDDLQSLATSGTAVRVTAALSALREMTFVELAH